MGTPRDIPNFVELCWLDKSASAMTAMITVSGANIVNQCVSIQGPALRFEGGGSDFDSSDRW